jgi:hypothetical protein
MVPSRSARPNVFGSGVDVGVVVDAAGEQQEVLGELGQAVRVVERGGECAQAPVARA